MASQTTAPLVLYSISLLLGLPLNALSLWVLICRHGLQYANTVMITNLAVSDLLLILIIPFRIFDYAASSWPFGDTVCKVTILVWRTNIMSSSFFITFISVDRMLAVVYPLRSRTLRSPRVSWIMCVAAWLLSITHCLPEFNCSPRKGSSTCVRLSFKDNTTWNNSSILGQGHEENSTCRSPPLFVLILIVCLLILLAINLISTATVTQILCKRQNDLMGHNIKKVIVLFAVNLIMFFLFFLPFVTVTLVVSMQLEPKLQYIEIIIAYASLNCCLDPIVYYFSLGAFRKRKEDTDS